MNDFLPLSRTLIQKKRLKKYENRLEKRKLFFPLIEWIIPKELSSVLEAFEFFLQKNPEYLEKVILIMVVVPSRIRVKQYQQLKQQVDELVGEINGKYATINWSPIRYLFQSIPFYELTALYYVADIALITPLKDGMNLVAKEFIATKNNNKGVLILSEMAGAAAELGEALIINPNNREQISWSIKIRSEYA